MAVIVVAVGVVGCGVVLELLCWSCAVVLELLCWSCCLPRIYPVYELLVFLELSPLLGSELCSLEQ